MIDKDNYDQFEFFFLKDDQFHLCIQTLQLFLFFFHTLKILELSLEC